MSAPWDVIVIGAGHNGLACAGVLARKGRRVLVVEAAGEVGGAARTREFAPGFRVSACAHLLHRLDRRLEGLLRPARHGLEIAARGLATVALDAGGEHLVLGGAADTARTVGAHASGDVAALAALRARLARLAAALAPLFERVPPRLASGAWSDRLALARLGLRLRRLGREDLRELLRIGAMNVADLVEDELEGALLQGALAFDAVLGTRLGPRSPGTVLTLLHRLAGEVGHGAAGSALAIPRGGMGALAEALAAALQARGGEVRCAAPVERVLVEEDHAAGVVLASGETLRAPLVVSSADPRTTFLELLGPRHLDAGFVRRVRNLRLRGTAAKLHLALDALPEFRGLEREQLGGRLLIAPSVDYLEEAFNPVKYGEHSAAPALEITIPTIHDPSLAPEGRHVLSAVVQYAPVDLAGGWEAARAGFTERLLEVLEGYAPGLRERVVASELLTPLELERDFRIAGGHWHHGEIGFDQFLMLRPLPGAAQYAAPLPGLYLCGAGSHPGGGVTASPGINAARRILEVER